ncbi:MAG: hypothetical protein ACLFSI_00745 [Halorhodospira sp.]
MKRNAEIVEQLQIYTNRRIPLLWAKVLALLIATHLIAAYLVEQFWSEHFAVDPWTGVAAALIALAFLLYEKVGQRFGHAELEFKRTAMGFWDYERGYGQCERIRHAAGLGFLGIATLYAGFLYGQITASAEDAERLVLTDLSPAAQAAIFSQPQQGSVLVAGAALLVGAMTWIHRVKAEIRSDLGA